MLQQIRVVKKTPNKFHQGVLTITTFDDFYRLENVGPSF